MTTLAQTAFYRIGRRYYAFGLEWLTAAPNATARRQAIRAARQAAATHLAWRKRFTQVGMARIDTAAPTYVSAPRAAAPAFADLQFGSLLAAFQFTDGRTWVFAASGNRIYPDGDRLFLDEEEAQTAFRVHYDKQRWHEIYAPADWGYHRATQIDPLIVLRAAARRGLAGAIGVTATPGVPLRRLPAPGAVSITPPAAFAAAIAVGGIYAAYAWHTAHSSKPVPEAPPPFYPAIVPAAAVLDRCAATLPAALTSQVIPGWDVTEITCATNGLSITLSARPYTPLSTMAAFRPEATINGTNRTATILLPNTTPATPMPLTLPLLRQTDYTAAFGPIDEIVHAQNAFNAAVAPTDPAPQQNGQPRKRPYKVMSWTFRTVAPPPLWATDLGVFANTAVTRVTARPAGERALTWEIEGTTYVAD